tara:strand:- start:973 stop:1215 length:243 start_codon:yes stop_codon:yes gene_type:complete
MCSINCSNSSFILLLIITILFTIKNEFFASIDFYEFGKLIIAFGFLIFILILFILFFKKIYNFNKINPEANNIENNIEEE